MASAICLTCGFVCKAVRYLSWDTKNSECHQIVIIAKGNIIENKEALQ